MNLRRTVGQLEGDPDFIRKQRHRTDRTKERCDPSIPGTKLVGHHSSSTILHREERPYLAHTPRWCNGFLDC